MEKLPMCRICLAENVRMHIVANRNLHELYEKLTDIPFVTEDTRPILACFFCCTKLKQCYQLLRQCLKAEELYAQMMNEDYKLNSLNNQNHLEVFSGLMKSPIQHISIVDECQTESIAIKDELPAVCEGLDDIIEPKLEHQSDELELNNFDSSSLDVADIPLHHSESEVEDDVPLMKFKTEVKEEQAVPQKKRRATETNKLELESFDNSCLDVADIPPHHSESDVEDDVPLMKLKTEVEEDQAVSQKKRRATETNTGATVAKKPKLDTRTTKRRKSAKELYVGYQKTPVLPGVPEDVGRRRQRPKMPREEKLKRKKLAERRRRERLKHNEEFKAKNRARYYKRKAEGKIRSIHDLNRHEQKARREKSRISTRKYTLKEKKSS